jgi:urease accessory protein
MYDSASRSEVALARACGRLALSFRTRGGSTVIDRLHQEGCLKARFPRPEDGAFTTAVLLNTAGGLTGGDVLRTDIALHEGAHAALAGQAAERIYRADAGSDPATVATRCMVAPGTTLEWLPQETILFDGCRLHRRFEVGLHGDARFLGLEILVFGRAAMGETLRHVELRDRWDISRDGTPLLSDRIVLAGGAALGQRAIGRAARAVATVVLAAEDAPMRLAAVRAAFGDEAEAGASAWNGLLVARVVARDAAAVRRTVMAALPPLRDGRPLPRVWLC